MYDVNPQSHRCYLADLERDALRSMQSARRMRDSRPTFGGLRAHPRAMALVLVCLLLGGIVGGALV